MHPKIIFKYISLSVFSVCSKKLFSTVHNFVHLNLAISLFVAYMIFAVCIELATRNEVGAVYIVQVNHVLAEWCKIHT